MSISDLPVLSALRTKMQWHQARQRVLSENVSNSDTPNFKPRDLVEPKFDATGSRDRLERAACRWRAPRPSHIRRPAASSRSFDVNGKAGFETRPAGNASISRTR